MATHAQTAANRRNAQHSTGPRTDEGKEKSARNATKFGLFTRHVLLPGEDESELTALRDGIRARLRPADALEEVYAERVVANTWRLHRALAGEAAIYKEWHRSEGLSGTEVFHAIDELDKLTKHIASLERSIDKAVSELGKLQKARRELPSDRNDENEPNSEQVEEVSGSMSIQIVKTNPIASGEGTGEGTGAAVGVDEGEIRENEQNEPDSPAGVEASVLHSPGDSDRP